MQYILGLSGTHGTGKTTILNGCGANGYNINTASLSRTAQKALGWANLSDAIVDVNSMWELQDAIINALYDRDESIKKTKTLTFVERTPADLWAYTAEWCKRLSIDPIKDRRAIEYKRKCNMLIHSYAGILIVAQNDAIPFVPEANRADLASRESVDQSIRKFTRDYGFVYNMESVTAADRIAEALTISALIKMKE